MKIYLIGNPLVSGDSVPLTLLEPLQKRFPQDNITHADPNENFYPEEGSIIIDTVVGIDAPTWYYDIDSFAVTNSVSPHDYDLSFHFQFLRKIHRLNRVKIIGIPPDGKPDQVLDDIVHLITGQTENKREK